MGQNPHCQHPVTNAVVPAELQSAALQLLDEAFQTTLLQSADTSRSQLVCHHQNLQLSALLQAAKAAGHAHPWLWDAELLLLYIQDCSLPTEQQKVSLYSSV